MKPNQFIKYTFVFITLTIARMSVAQTSGNLDTNFVPDTASGSTDSFWQMALQTNGQIIVTGRETAGFNINGSIYRLNSDGSRDSSLASGQRASTVTGANAQITSPLVLNDGNILIGGYFTYVDQTVRAGLARLNSVGTIDSSYTPSAFPTLVEGMVLQPDGKCIVVGGFTNFMGTGQRYVVRLNADGSVDNTFSVGSGPNAKVWSVTLASDGKILIGGDFTGVDVYSCGRVARLNLNGTVDTSFNADAVDSTVYAIAVQSDGRVVIGGTFQTVGTSSRVRVARLNSNGTVDSSFNAGSVCNANVWAVALQSNGKILVGGRFNAVGGDSTTRSKIVCLNTNGTIDPNFDSTAGSGAGSSDEVRAIKIQPDGKILVCGKFTVFSGQTRYRMARLYGDPVVTATAPFIVSQPQSRNANSGDASATFAAVAFGTDPLSYQWYFNNNLVSTGTSSSLNITNVQPINAGTYYVVVTNSAGTSTSSNAVLNVQLVLPWLANITRQANSITMELHCSPGRTNILEGVADLGGNGNSPVWTRVGTYYPPVFPPTFTTNAPAAGSYFYRLSSP
jgi:uncharacterized delta-60 repeat protein